MLCFIVPTVLIVGYVNHVFRQIVKKHLQTLAVRHAQTITRDVYGNETADKWIDEINYFYENVVKREIPSADYFNGKRNLWKLYIHDAVEKYNKEYRARNNFDPTMTPYEYEQYCGRMLENTGWKARVTQASVDQGVDILAEKDGRRLFVQCKLYSRPVGNKAVQEISAGKQYEHADIAAVVSNQSFTPAARKLAEANRVMLMHHSELAAIDVSAFLDEGVSQSKRRAV